MNFVYIIHSRGSQMGDVKAICLDEGIADATLDSLNKDWGLSGSHFPPYQKTEFPLADSIEIALNSKQIAIDLRTARDMRERLGKMNPQARRLMDTM